MLEDRPDGSVVSAKVLPSEVDDEVLVEFGDQLKAVVPQRDFGVTPRPGDEVDIYIEHPGPEANTFVGSHDKAMRLRILDRIEGIFERSETIEGDVVGTIEGGFVVDVGLRAFLPSSQLALKVVSDPDRMLGQSLRFKVLRFNRARANVVLSRRAVLEVERKELMKNLRVGAVVDATVEAFVDVGVRVDVAGAQGFIHHSDVSWNRSQDPKELLSIGQKVRLKVLKFDKKRGRVQLGLRQVQDDPWANADERYPPGTEVRGMVVSKTDFGCFIEFEPGLEGLVPTSGPLTSGTSRDVLRKAEIGDELLAVVVDVNLTSKRIGLQLKTED